MANLIYSNARAKALEKNLLSGERLNRMVESVSAEEALKVLYEVNFGNGQVLSSALDFELLVGAEEKKLLEFIKEVGASEEVKGYFLAKYDYHNAEALIKAKYLKIDPAPIIVSDGRYAVSSMKDKIFTDEYGSFSKPLATALLSADNLFVSGTATGKNIDDLFKRALYDELYELSSKDNHLKTIYDFKADATNIFICLRTRNLKEAEKTFVKGGKLKDSEKQALCELSVDEIKNKFYVSSYKQFVLSAIAAFQENLPLVEAEKAADDYALKLLNKIKYDTEGITPFLLYVYYKLAEIANVRIIMVGLQNGLNKNSIKAKLRRGYEG